MSDSDQDIDKTLEYRAAAAIAGLLPTGLLAILIGLVLFVLGDASDRRESWGMYGFIVLTVVSGIGVVAWALWTRARHGKPLFTLSPDGIHYCWGRTFLIPWHDIQGVDTINIVSKQLSPLWLFSSGPSPLYRVGFHGDVTVVVVSRRFYDTHIHINSFFLRGPGWKATFIPAGDLVQVALHHELVSVEAARLRQAVESRWLAFRDRMPARRSVPVTGASGRSFATPPNGIAMGDNPRTISVWQGIQIAVLLGGIAVAMANIAGFWQLAGQPEAREARSRANEARTQRDIAQKRMQEETRQREADAERVRRENEDVLRRAFGR